MRNELELMEQIEKYLLNKMTNDDKSAFEKQLQSDASLRAEVEKQRQLTEAVKNSAAKQNISKATKKFFLKKNLFKWGLGGSGLIATALVVVLATGNNPFAAKTHDPYWLPEVNENNETFWADADKYLPAQRFSIDNTQDTVVQTKDGILLAIPANCFLDKSGKPINGDVELNLKEALKPEEIIKAGLDTRTTDGQLLESGGMFYINPMKDGENVKIDPTKGIYVEVPTNKNKEGMQLYEGQRMPDGGINWKNPRKPEKFLTTVDIFSLDFYPEHYLDHLKELKQNHRNKEFTDSLYYSYAKYFLPQLDTASAYGPAWQKDTIDDIVLMTDSVKQIAWILDKVRAYSHKMQHHPIGINPAKIKAIWSNEFQGTFIATKEFEERLRLIFKTCDETFLDLYVNNVDKRMSLLDSMAASMESHWTDDFRKLAARGDGRVKTSQPHLKKLQEYYDRVAKMETEIMRATADKFQHEQDSLNNVSTVKQIVQSQEEIARTLNNFNKEYTINLDEGYRQLGYVRTNATIPATITGPGWYNLDKAVFESTSNRTTLDYTDPLTGKKAVIKYEPFNFNAKRNDFDRITVYLLPDSLYSFMRVKQEGNIFKESLNELLKYDLVAIGYKGNEIFYFESADVKPGNLDAKWDKISAEELDKKLASQHKNAMGEKVLADVNFYRFMIKDKQRKEKEAVRADLEYQVRPVVLPCYRLPEITEANNAAAPAARNLKHK